MKKVIQGVAYKGEPIYEEWNAGRTLIEWGSREVQPLPDGWRKLVRLVPLHSVKIDRRYGTRRIQEAVCTGREFVLRIKGVRYTDEKSQKRKA